MKALMMKIAGISDEKKFYQKYPTEEAFMKKHGKALKKANGGLSLLLSNQPTYSINAPSFPNNTLSNSGYGFKGMQERYMENNPVQSSFGSSSIGGGSGLGKGMNFGSIAGSVANTIPDLIQGFQDLKAEKTKRKSAQQWANISDVVLQAANTKPEMEQRRYVRPEDYINTGEEYFPVYGTGTNVLAKNGTEITNKYTGGKTLYSDLEYTPLKAADGTSIDPWSMGADTASSLITGIGGENAGGNIGGTLGKTAGTIIGGPVGGAVGQVAGQIFGGLLDRNPHKLKVAQSHIDKNMNRLSLSNNFGGVQQQYSSFMENGGQLKEKSNMGGDLQTYWGGHAETMSVNPFLPDGGETVMFRGQSHDNTDGKGNTGIGVSYGNNPVEVEGGEPAVKLRNGGNEDLVVFGNLNIPKGILDDPNAKGKFKNYVADLSKKEGKQNKIVDKSMDKLNDLDIVTSFDKLKLQTMKANLTGANMKLKDIAEKKEKAAHLQKAINEYADENNLVADSLSKGKIKKADKGTNISPGVENSDYIDLIYKYFPDEKGFSAADRQKAYDIMMQESGGDPNAVGINNNPNITNPKGQYWNSKDTGLFQINSAAHPNIYKAGDVTNPEYNIASAAKIALAAKQAGKDPFSPWTSYNNSLKAIPQREQNQLQPLESISVSSLDNTPLDTTSLATGEPWKPSEGDGKKNKFDWMQAINSVVPYLRPSDAERLDPRQLAGEMYAMSHNQLEPVYAQTTQPDLTVPYDISLQDMMNANEADYRASLKNLANNPAAIALLNAQKYGANEKVLGEQFRQNQAEKNRVYEQNRNIVDQSKVRNLGILDTQQQRQSLAKSNTKAIAQKALESISNKYLQNQLENRTLKTYENLYNYRYDNNGRAINMNPTWRPNIPEVGYGNPSNKVSGIPNDWMPLYDESGNFQGTKKRPKSKNGSIVKAMKGY